MSVNVCIQGMQAQMYCTRGSAWSFPSFLHVRIIQVSVNCSLVTCYIIALYNILYTSMYVLGALVYSPQRNAHAHPLFHHRSSADDNR